MVTLGELIFTAIVVGALFFFYFIGKEVGIEQTNKAWRERTAYAAKIRERESRRVA